MQSGVALVHLGPFFFLPLFYHLFLVVECNLPSRPRIFSCPKKSLNSMFEPEVGNFRPEVADTLPHWPFPQSLPGHFRPFVAIFGHKVLKNLQSLFSCLDCPKIGSYMPNIFCSSRT